MNAALPPSLSRPASYFPALTGVRALAAYLVFGHHVSLTLRGFAPELIALMHAGHTGVTVFFVLSGFLISYNYQTAFRLKQISKTVYILRRIARIYPLYLLLTVLVLLWKQDFQLWHWFLNLTLLKGLFAQEKFTGIAQGWSLTVEECFYLSAPLLLLVGRKISWLFVVILAGAGFLLVSLTKLNPTISFMQGREFMLEFTIFGRAFEFYVGYLLAQLQFKSKIPLKSGISFTVIGCILFLVGLGTIAWLENYELTVFNGIPIAILFNNLALPLAIFILFYGIINEKSLLSRFLGSAPLQVLGRSSYAFYLIHAGMVFEILFFHFFQNRWLIFLVINVIAIGLYYFWEKPAEAYLRRKLANLKQTPGYN